MFRKIPPVLAAALRRFRGPALSLTSSLRATLLAGATAAAVTLLPGSAQAMSVVPPSFTQLVGAAEQIVQVQVTATHGQWDTAPNGQPVIHTYVDCSVQSVIKGTAPTQLTLRFLGGDVGESHLVVSDMPKLEVGGTYLVFLAQNQRAFCPLVGVMHGAYRVLRDAAGTEHIARFNGEALHSVDDIRAPMSHARATPDASGLTVGEFRAAIADEQRRIAARHEN
jgi:hypothetical protein